MKKAITVLISFILCVALLSACSGNKDVVIKSEKLSPTEAIDAEKLKADEDFAGDFKSDIYTAHIEKDKNGEMVVTIRSAVKNNIGYEWKISGFFANETYRINYTEATKYVITYKSDKTEKSRKKEYEGGSGRIQFSDSNSFKWNNDMEKLESDKEFERIEK